MSRPQPSAPQRERRSRTTLAAFAVGLPLAAAVLSVLLVGPLRDTPARRYVSHEVEWVEVAMFCCAVAALGAKGLSTFAERRACRAELLPPWDGETVPVAEAGPLLDRLGQLPRGLQESWVVKRTAAVLDFLRSRGSAAELDDHLRTLADNDAVALDGSYALTRFITWAVPILGFLGTVLGITGAIAGVTPDKLEHSLSEVTDGLALAFDATALALGLTMVTMFLSFLVERAEQSVLEAVDRFVDRELAHRFERAGGEGGGLIEAARRQTEVLIHATGQLVERQALVWAKTLEEVNRSRAEAEAGVQARLTAALAAALEQTLDAHGRRLAALEETMLGRWVELTERMAAQHAALAQVAQAVSQQVAAISRMQESENQLVRSQELLAQNLATLAGAASFDEAVNSLTAAVHLLTARAAPGGKPGLRPGAAA